METVVKEEPKDLEDWCNDEQHTSFDNFVKVEINTATYSGNNGGYVEEDHKYVMGSSNEGNYAAGSSSTLVKIENDSETEDQSEDDEESDDFTHQQMKRFDGLTAKPEYIYEPQEAVPKGRNGKRVKKTSQTFQCDLCDIRRKRIGSLETHMKNVHEDKKMQQCHLCDYSTNYSCELQDHLYKIHSKFSRQRAPIDQPKTYECDYCDFVSKWKSTLNRHMNNIHKRLKKLNCHLCGYRTTHERNLEIHVKNVHFLMKTSRKNFLCNKVLVRFHLDNVRDLPTSHWCCLCDHTYCGYE